MKGGDFSEGTGTMEESNMVGGSLDIVTAKVVAESMMLL